MKGKKIVEFLILKPAFTSRNLSSLGLVAIFFLVYWLAGGKVAVPNVKQGSNFGSVTSSSRTNQNIIGSGPKNEIVSPSRNGAVVPNNFDPTPASSKPDESTKALEEKLNKLNELEERLKSLKRAKTGGD